jgi:hypothetical protein
MGLAPRSREPNNSLCWHSPNNQGSRCSPGPELQADRNQGGWEEDRERRCNPPMFRRAAARYSCRRYRSYCHSRFDLPAEAGRLPARKFLASCSRREPDWPARRDPGYCRRPALPRRSGPAWGSASGLPDLICCTQCPSSTGRTLTRRGEDKRGFCSCSCLFSEWNLTGI